MRLLLCLAFDSSFDVLVSGSAFPPSLLMNTHADEAVRTRLITMACDNRELGVRSGVRATAKALCPHPSAWLGG